MSEVRRWLDSLGLGCYGDAFERNAIERDVLSELDHDVLISIGIDLAGHRLRILKAARELPAVETPVPAIMVEAKSAGSESAPLGAAERRQLTVMFCDLADSTTLATQLDAEDLRDVLSRFQDACRDAVGRFEGFIARYMGDGVLVYFGYPRAHEDDPERAVRAGLEILAAIPRMNAQLQERFAIEVAVRIGMATGEVVVGDIIGEGAAEEAAVVGETPNLAARLQGSARPGELIVNTSAARRLPEAFRLTDLGELDLKGIATPVHAWRVVGGEVSVSAATDSRDWGAPLVGRREELGLALRAWDGAKAGRGQCVLIQGEAGIGKSRLSDALRRNVVEDGYARLAIDASPYHLASPLYPVTMLLRQSLGWEESDDQAAQMDKLEQFVRAQPMLDAIDTVRALSELLALDSPEFEEFTAREKRELTLDVLTTWLLGTTDAGPVLMTWEDLQWADPSSIELLESLLSQVATVPMLIVCTYRSEFVPRWPMRSHITPITLNRLEPVEVHTIASHLASPQTLPEAVIEHIAEKSDGVPLYVEELTKAILEADLLNSAQGDLAPLAEMKIPETLQDSLMSRLDRVPAVREVAQIGAVIGREFNAEVLRETATIDDDTLQDGLSRLVESELLYQRGRGAHASYLFKHALIQDAAYQSLLRRPRELLHARVAEVLERSGDALSEGRPELLAHHFSRSRQRPEKAIDYWRLAADSALSRGANQEAATHLAAALGDLGGLPASHSRDEEELELLTKLGPAIAATRGYTVPELRECYARAQALCERLGDAKKLALIVRGQQLSHMVTGDVYTSASLAQQLVDIVAARPESTLRAGAYAALAQTQLMLGRVPLALQHAGTAMQHLVEDMPRTEGWAGGQPREVSYLWCALANLFSGQVDTAVTVLQDGLELARRDRHPLSFATLLTLGSLVPGFRGDYRMVKELAQEGRALCSEHAIEYWLPFAEFLLIWADAKMDPTAESADRLERAASAFEGLQSWANMPLVLALLSSACLDAREVMRGLHAVERALVMVAKNNEQWMRAELHRLEAELLVCESSRAIEEALLAAEQAVRTARDQGAGWLELRSLNTAFGLARRAEMDTASYRAGLVEYCGQAREGRDTADFRLAAAFLAE